MTAPKNVAFAWNEKNTAQAIELYNEAIKKDGQVVANSTASLKKIADELKAKSAQSVRSKLSTEGVYTKVEASAGTTTAKAKPTKIGLVRNIEKVLGKEQDSLETLSKANVNDLEDLTAAIVALGTDEAVTQAYIELQERQEAEAEAEAA